MIIIVIRTRSAERSIAKHDSKPPQRFHRIRTTVADAFHDLELLLGNELPEEKEEHLFSADTIKKLAQALLKSPRERTPLPVGYCYCH